MRLSDAVLRRATTAIVGLIVAVGASAARPAPASSLAGDLDAARRECIAAAHDTQQREQAVATLAHRIDLFRRDAEGRQRDLDQSRPEQARVLGAIEVFQRHASDRLAFFRENPLDRARSEMLVEGTVAGLRAELRALSAEIKRVAELRNEIAARQGELAGARDAVESGRAHLTQLVARRLDLTRRLSPEASGENARFARLGRQAADIADLIKLADAAIDRREAADPTRPRDLRVFDPPHSALVMPVSDPITRGFGATERDDADASKAASQGLSIAAAAGAEAVAPYDGRVIYAGPFRDRGVVLIIRHAGLYHTVLAGLGRADVGPGEWVLAGEPVGAMPDAVDKITGRPLYFELRHDGRPVDPHPWLAIPDEGRDPQNGDQKVRE